MLGNAEGNQLSLDSPNIFDYLLSDLMVPSERILSPTPFEYNENIDAEGNQLSLDSPNIFDYLLSDLMVPSERILSPTTFRPGNHVPGSREKHPISQESVLKTLQKACVIRIWLHWSTAPGGSLVPTPAPTAFQVIQNFTVPQQVFSIPVANAVHPGSPTFVIVPAAPVSSPGAAGTPSSPDAVTSPCKGSQSPLRSLKTPEKPKSVEEFKESLRSYLLDTCQFVGTEDEVSLESLHIDVPLIQRQVKIKTGKNANKCLEKELIICDAAERRRAEIPRSQIFHPNGEGSKDSKVMALLGKAGLGKSMLVQKLCQDWSRGDFQQFELVFWFACKRLNLSGKRFGLRNLLFRLFEVPPPENADEVFKYLLRNPEKVLIIFDGFDDFQDCEGLLHSPATSSSKEIYSIKDLFSGLFQKKLLIGSTVLVTARPKEMFNQFLGKVDKIVELSGFTPEDIELYMSRYFKGTSYCDGAWRKVQNNGFLFSLCSTPLICRLVCFLLEHFDMSKDLPSTLTGLYCHVFYHRMHANAYAAGPVNRQQKQNIPDLGSLAWEGVQDHKCLLNPRDLSSEELKEFGLSSGILSPHPASEDGEEGDFGLGFAHLITQNFLGALHLILAKNISGKSLVKQVLLEKKKKKPEEDWLDVLRRFLVGLLFQPAECSYLDCLSAKAVVSKKDTLSEYLKKIKPSDLNPSRLLELCHCVYETGNMGLVKHMVSKLPSELSFRGTPLSPPDVFVLQHLLNKTRRAFALDLHETGIDLCGIKQLVGQKSVTSFRVPKKLPARHLPVCGHTCQFVGTEDEVSLESLHIDVPLIQRQVKIKTGKNANKCLEKELIICDAAERRRAEIPRSQIFHPNGEGSKDSKVMALLGKAGLGKSMLVQKLCQDWSRGDFQQFELVFWFACKRLNLSGKRFGLRNLLFRLFEAPPPENADEVFRYLLRNPEKVLIIFDGFDDFQDCEGLLHSPATSSCKEIYSIKDLFSGLFQKKLLIGSTVLVTARPKEMFNQFLGKVDKIVELSGFTPEDIELYMSRYFKGTSYCDGAWRKVQNNGFLFSLCSTPLICRLVCFLLEHFDMSKDLPSTLTGLYCHVFYHRMHVKAYAAGPVNRQQKQNVPDLGSLAWEGVQDHKCLLNPRDLSSEELKEFGLSSGILSPHPASEGGEEGDFGLGFAHLITQNFLGALHLILAKNISGKSLVKQVLLEKKQKKPEEDWLDVLRRFLVGLLFQPAECSYLDCLSAKAVVSKKDTLSEYLKRIKPSDLNPSRLLSWSSGSRARG
ncbi:UNVERIFIED_CONTAM: hypothetical protein FKN15_054818 [Acipenser sinensis]